MCFCCCVTRKSILIYTVVISSFAFIYGIVAVSRFGSSTEIYKALIDKLKQLEEQSDSSSNSRNNYPYPKTKQNRRIDSYGNSYNMALFIILNMLNLY